MTDDLVGRLDRLATHLEAFGDDGAATVSEAAARIEALETEKAGLLGRIDTMADDLVLMGMARDRYAEVLRTFLTEYVALVESGDAGFWDPETEPKVIAARQLFPKDNPHAD